MRILSFSGWPQRVQALIARGVPDLASTEAISKLLADLNHEMLTSPNHIMTSYDTLSEEELHEWELVWDRRIVNAESLAIDFSDDRICALQLGSLIRAIDRILLDHRPHLGPPSDPAEWSVGDVYVMPRVNQSSVGKRNQGYRVRGLRHHRIIPQTIGDLNVRIKYIETVEHDIAKPRRRFGAAVFQDFEANLSQAAVGKFHVEGVNVRNYALDLESQLEASSKEDCFVVVWPELTMPSSYRNEVRRILKQNALSDEVRVYPDIFVAGSWHEMDQGNRYNISYVIDRFGRSVASYKKTVAYSDDSHGAEDIRLGSELLVLVTDIAVFAIGICKDFCTINRDPSPYHYIDADFVLVPSMGGDSTILEHQVASHTLRNVNGARVFVVQQNISQSDGVAAFVLPPSRAKGENAVRISNGQIWASFT